ncbi:glycosyltransferase family 2 protein [Sporosarcina sp. SAFN-015]|uniref:glycosyltransferase family 2 protein n=1 Tax=Sporosarcina sp. SAFN-015 TaxID=3387274 RepID=UPI003F7DE8AA
MDKKITIIIPVYNKEKFLSKTIESVLSQSYKNFELIIIDDGSTDLSLKVINEFARRDTRIHVYTQRNSGVSAARNNGIMKATGTYITFLDADDFYDEHFLQKMLLAVQGYYAAFCGHVYHYPNGKKIKANMNWKGELLKNYINNKCTPNTNSWIIDKKWLIDNQLFFSEDLNWGEDMLFFGTIFTKTKNINYCKEYLSNYRLEISNSLSENDFSKINKEKVWINRLVKIIENEPPRTKTTQRNINLLLEYRLPALIIYRLYNHKTLTNKDEFLSLFEENIEIIKKVSYINGIRSIKLIVYQRKLFKFYEKLKGE